MTQKELTAKIQACIFDLDGVIVDTAKYHFLAWKKLANELGFDFTEHQNELLKGVSRQQSLEILLEIGKLSLNEKHKEQLMEKKNAWYLEYIERMMPQEVLPRVQHFLDELKAHKIKLAIGSASKNAQKILTKIKLDHYFDVIIDGNVVSKAKPDPEVFLAAAHNLQIVPQNCVVFEDSLAGIEAAINGGMYCIGVGLKSTLGRPGVSLVISSFAEMSYEKLQSI